MGIYYFKAKLRDHPNHFLFHTLIYEGEKERKKSVEKLLKLSHSPTLLKFSL